MAKNVNPRAKFDPSSAGPTFARRLTVKSEKARRLRRASSFNSVAQLTA
jgi:hypothetical protein